ncbi:LysR family transcriptional regulator [Jiangella sp. DSM 45060]|uniref:LysR family transcriptional regulator n=1 Tax=Jiangella sp. DSM 45060 TaxID=1798224 RepID=UPI00087AD60C|nr:LysR substrate-binding domain-containing protein [Jiangella sp. DSM 45060]SDT71264.1 DNA-binding transcriptional regulator, LysR family [Jiangella sp. DSM 45060]
MLDLTRLRVLVAVAREGSVTAAADALHYAQPSVSHHLARLEAEVGLPLTQRAGRGVRLTEAGELLARRAEEILGQVEAAETELSAHAGLRTGRVRLAAFPSALATLVPTAAARFAAAHPDVELALTEAEPPAALTALRTGAVDVAVVFAHGPLEERGVTVEPLLTEPLYLVTPADDAPAGDVPAGGALAGDARVGDAEFGPRPAGRVPTLRAGTDRLTRAAPASGRAAPASGLAAFAGARWIAGCERCREHLVGSCERAGFTPAIAFETDDYVAVQALVAAGLGVSTLPGLALAANRHPGVRADPLPGDGRTVAVATYGRSPAPLPVQAFRTALREAAAEFTRW